MQHLESLLERAADEETMRNIASILLKYNSEHIVDYSKRYNLTDKKDESTDVSKVTTEVQEAKEQVASTVMEEVQEAKNIENDPLYIRLKQYRWDKSREEGNKPYFLYSNLVLEELVKSKPSNIEELMKIKGFGKVKCEKYGQDIISIIKED
ncbi:HRDC domain-containing protein [Clostridium sp. SM-530-WT-3G]|uniref:HRDC domain-containing protein n=1 Tax=Clostridium sp. SM-530-WT-3G TaxID=2725303 RepID=UPI00145DA5D2|nr:HRDC domain-containing protein [Clostridium sp. SM-530-WT-3G]NME81556.1 hypothetical protein [Clostridium sp. SM-530-WT-3G]